MGWMVRPLHCLSLGSSVLCNNYQNNQQKRLWTNSDICMTLHISNYWSKWAIAKKQCNRLFSWFLQDKLEKETNFFRMKWDMHLYMTPCRQNITLHADNIILSKRSEIYHLLGVFYKSLWSAPCRPDEKDIQQAICHRIEAKTFLNIAK